MILYHVAYNSRAVKIGAPVLYANVFQRIYLYGLNVAGVPYRVKKGVGKAEDQNILHRFLGQVVVYAEYLQFVKVVLQVPVKFPGAFNVVAEGFFR